MTTLWEATEQDAAEISPWLPVAMIAIAAFYLWRTVIKRQDRRVTESLRTAAMCVFFMAVGSLLLSEYGTMFAHLSSVGMVLAAGLITASWIAYLREGRAARMQRAALNLAPRPRLLSPATLSVLWFVGAFLALIVYACVATVIMMGLNLPIGSNTNTQDVAGLGGLVVIGVMGIAGFIHVKMRQRQIVAEDERIRRLDLEAQSNTGDDSQDSDPDPSP